MNRLATATLRGAAAGAAATTALNAATYLDMALRGRPASSTPQRTVETLADRAHVTIPGDRETRWNRVEGLAPLASTVAGVGAGMLLGASRTVARPRFPAAAALATLVALMAGNGPMTALAVTDPRRWSLEGWVSDVVPHVAYGLVAAAVLVRLDDPA